MTHRATAPAVRAVASNVRRLAPSDHNGAMVLATVVSFIITKIQHLPGGLVYGLVALLVFGEAALFIGFVLPGETSVIVAGVVASRGHVNIGVLVGLVVLAAIIGDSVGYEVGKRYGEQLLRLPILRKRQASLHRALEGLAQRGPLYVFLGRFTAFLRAVMPGLAGLSGMRYRRFLLANALGGIAWGTSYSLLGYYAGSALTTIETYSTWVGAILLIVIVGGYLVIHLLRRRRDLAIEATWEAEHPDESAKQSE